MLIEVKDADAFLEHFGVKGQRWGVRKQVSKKGNVSYQRSNLQKAAIAGGAIGAANVSARFASQMTRGKTASRPISIIAGGVGLLAGARAARQIVDRNNDVPVGALKGKHLGDKGATKNEKAYLAYVGLTALAAGGMSILTNHL